MKPKVKRKPRPEELGNHQNDIEYRGRKYVQTVVDKVGNDGVMESHITYEDKRHRPIAPKRKPNVIFQDGKWWKWSHKLNRFVRDLKKAKW